jgi:hypothetical protein
LAQDLRRWRVSGVERLDAKRLDALAERIN